MPFTVGPNQSNGTTPVPSPHSSRSNLRSGLTNLLPSTSKTRGAPDERTSLLDGERESHTPRRSWTADLDATQTEDDGSAHASTTAEDRGKNDDAGESLFSTAHGGMSFNDKPGQAKPQVEGVKRKSVRRVIRQRAKYYVPMTEWLPNYSWSLFSGDLIAGVSLACLLVPQSISYANGLAKLSPIAGLWSAAIPAFIYGILGTCRQLSLGPEAALSLLIGQMVQEQVYGDPHTIPAHPELEAAAIAVITTFQIGLITSALGLLRLGFLDVVLSRPLLRGFITAVGIIIFIEQLVPMLGLAAILAHPEAKAEPPNSPLEKLLFVIDHVDHINKTTMTLALASLGFLIFVRSIKPRLMTRPGAKWVRFVPEILLAVVIGTTVTGIFRLDERGVDILGKVQAGHGSPLGWPLSKRAIKYSDYTFSTAFVCAIVGIVDSIVAARENGTKYGYPVGPNRELVALGAANLTSSLFVHTGSVPVFGSVTRSRLNGSTGGRTQMSSIITGILIVLSIFFLLPWLSFLPKAVLAAIVVLVVYAILAEAPHEMLFLWRMRAWTDFLQMTGTFILTLLFSIEIGLVASVVFSLVLVIQKSTQTRIKIIGRLPGTEEWVPIDEDETAQEEIPGVLVVRIRENLSFANTGQLKERLRRLERYGMQKSHPSDEPRRDSAEALILHMGDVEEIDASAVQILQELTKAYTESGVGVHFAHLRPAHMSLFELVGIAEQVGHTHFHNNLRSAMNEIEALGVGSTVTARFPV